MVNSALLSGGDLLELGSNTIFKSTLGTTTFQNCKLNHKPTRNLFERIKSDLVNYKILPTKKRNRKVRVDKDSLVKDSVIKTQNNSICERVGLCGHTLLKGEMYAKIVSDNNYNASFLNVMKCGNIWACDTCSITKLNEKQKLLEAIAKEHLKSGGDILLVTLTTSHYLSDELSEMIKIKDVYSKMRGTRPFKRLEQKYGIQFSCKALEITYGLVNGWHPHLHLLFYTKCRFTKKKRAKLEYELYQLWLRACENNAFRLPNLEHGVDVSNGRDCSKYVAKWSSSNELTSHSFKKSNGGYSIFQLKEMIVSENPELPFNKVANLLRTYFESIIGTHILSWSGTEKHLKDKYLSNVGLVDSPDDVIPDDDIQEIREVIIHKDILKQIKHKRIKADTLTTFELYGFNGLDSYLQSKGINTDSLFLNYDNDLSDDDMREMKNSFIDKYNYFPDTISEQEFRFVVLNYEKLMRLAKSQSNLDFNFDKYGIYSFTILKFCNKYRDRIYSPL